MPFLDVHEHSCGHILAPDQGDEGRHGYEELRADLLFADEIEHSLLDQRVEADRDTDQQDGTGNGRSPVEKRDQADEENASDLNDSLARHQPANRGSRLGGHEKEPLRAGDYSYLRASMGSSSAALRAG